MSYGTGPMARERARSISAIFKLLQKALAMSRIPLTHLNFVWYLQHLVWSINENHYMCQNRPDMAKIESYTWRLLTGSSGPQSICLFLLVLQPRPKVHASSWFPLESLPQLLKRLRSDGIRCGVSTIYEWSQTSTDYMETMGPLPQAQRAGRPSSPFNGCKAMASIRVPTPHAVVLSRWVGHIF